MHGSSRNVFMCTALLALLLCAAARDFDADVNSMHAPVAHRRQDSQELGRKLHKLEAQESKTLNPDHAAEDDGFPPHGHPDPNASVDDDGFPQHGQPDLNAGVCDDGFLQHGEVGGVEGIDKEEAEKDELAQFAPAAQCFILADYDVSVVLGVNVIVLGVIALLFCVGVVCGFRLHRVWVSNTNARSCATMLAPAHEQNELEQEQEETEAEELEPAAPELVQPAREHVRRKEIGFRTNSSVKRHFPQHSTFSNGHTRVQNAQQHPSLGGEVGPSHMRQNSLETSPVAVDKKMRVDFRTAAETTGQSNDKHPTTSSHAFSPASSTTTGSTEEATPPPAEQANKRRRSVDDNPSADSSSDDGPKTACCSGRYQLLCR
mmetsp:Transcript_33740/g.54404  ORF Transcript_33740/g.54404 Transcript_33740/m.54404 type:complete len:375 (+) Transcript_33740:75-1199(+)